MLNSWLRAKGAGLRVGSRSGLAIAARKGGTNSKRFVERRCARGGDGPQ